MNVGLYKITFSIALYSNQLKNICMPVEDDELCMCTKFGGHGVSGFGDFAPLKNSQNFFQTMDSVPYCTAFVICLLNKPNTRE